ncbi:hypothetical protein JTE90_008734 [Oedothorax gibbosus]|uniref:DNA mismatch repair proteins mutS family domain-containing protein n=1 Tax=Oedothorax gibbosus TaxID=931172 RepID=A0AAV6UR27_9ARAC|nr:hypothetical protein JTE90_008734 [Oedothorax gibbosus]
MGDKLKGEFINYYNQLPKTSCLCRIYERNDGYCLYGEDAKLVSKFMATLKLKTMESGEGSLNYVKLTKGHLIKLLRHLLFVIQYKVEILRSNGSIRNPEWTVEGKASPGNLTAVEDLLFSDDNSYVMTQRGLMAIKMTTENNDLVLGIAFCDVLLREIQICQFTDNPQLSILQSVLAQLSPQECLLPIVSKAKQNEASAKQNVEEAVKTHGIAITELSEFNPQFIVQDLNRLLRFDEGQDFLNSMKEESELKLALCSVAAIIKYLKLLSDENNFGQFTLSTFQSELYAKVDLSCELGLGLFPEMKSDFHDKTYLFGYINSCFTSAGERLLIQWIKQPLMDVKKLEERLDIVEAFVNDISFQNDVSKVVDKFIDVEMLCRKIQRRKANLQDLYKIYQMLQRLPSLSKSLLGYSGPHEHVLKSNFIGDLQERIEDFENFSSMIAQTIDFDAIQNREFVVKAEYDETLQDLREQMDKLKKSMDSELEAVKEDLGITTVKLEVFEKLGYMFRLTLKEESNLRNKKGYITFDTRASGVRFQSPELKELNDRYNIMKKDYEETQKKIVDQMVDVSASYIQPLKLLGGLIAWIDAALSLSRVAIKASKTYIRPKLRAQGECHIVLKQCRHPFLEDQVQNYIPNDVEITKEGQRFYFVTGPNMGGKSTFIRSVALNVLLAQIGSFVPCDEAEISVVDAFFTRIGACDKPSKAMSTFMYEMLEMKNMIKFATPSSLLIIDEMGRGTSTYDGLGLSWSISRHIAENIQAPCLFATHFHDLTTMSKTILTIGNLNVDALCSDGDVTFLYRVKPGVCNESFGIHVAKLAGFPDKVIEQAEKKLKELDTSLMTLEEISNAFSSFPQGKELIQALKEVFTFEESASNDEVMETDDLETDAENTNMDIESNNVGSVSSSTKFSEAERILKALEELEKEICG